MKLRIGALMLAILGAAATSTSMAQSSNPKLPDAVTADPKHYTVVFENDIVRLLRVRLDAGDTAPQYATCACCRIRH